ncbi:preprotein translocase subunit SecG [Candidatus Nomurabacteria bacterium]|nr:preprotein translocase subunit SecG [Candidatus Nomurabacteria bacterium]
MEKVLTIAQVIVGIVMMLTILLQQKGDGLGAGFGGTGGGVTLTKRGVDLFLHRATIVLALIFFALGVAMLVI